MPSMPPIPAPMVSYGFTSSYQIALESPLGSKEIKSVNPKGNQS